MGITTRSKCSDHCLLMVMGQFERLEVETCIAGWIPTQRDRWPAAPSMGGEACDRVVEQMAKAGGGTNPFGALLVVLPSTEPGL